MQPVTRAAARQLARQTVASGPLTCLHCVAGLTALRSRSHHRMLCIHLADCLSVLLLLVPAKPSGAHAASLRCLSWKRCRPHAD